VTTFPIVALGDGEVAAPSWFADITAAVNDHEDRVTVVESAITRVVRKTADETVSSDSTLSNDSQLSMSVEAGASYAFDSVVFFNTNGTANYKGQWTVPTGALLTFQCTGYSLAGTFGIFWNTDASLQTMQGNATPRPHAMSGTLIVAGTAGNITWQWAQNTSNASNTSTLLASYIRLTKVVS
jgi:hypothetical protein